MSWLRDSIHSFWQQGDRLLLTLCLLAAGCGTARADAGDPEDAVPVTVLDYAAFPDLGGVETVSVSAGFLTEDGEPLSEGTVRLRVGETGADFPLDGAGELRTFASVVFPMIKPGIGALAIFTFVNTWNDYFLQLVMLITEEKWTLPLAIANMQGEMSTDYGLIMAGAALASVPIIIVFIAFQKYFTQGITMGAVKG